MWLLVLDKRCLYVGKRSREAEAALRFLCECADVTFTILKVFCVNYGTRAVGLLALALAGWLENGILISYIITFLGPFTAFFKLEPAVRSRHFDVVC